MIGYVMHLMLTTKWRCYIAPAVKLSKLWENEDVECSGIVGPSFIPATLRKFRQACRPGWFYGVLLKPFEA